MNHHQSIRNDLQEAWNRFLDNSYTGADISLILDSLKEDRNLQDFYEVSNKVWHLSITDRLPETEEEKKTYRKEATRLIAQYERKRKLQVLSRNIGTFRRKWLAAAAILLISLLTPAIYRDYLKPKMEQVAVQYVEAVTQRGEIKTIVLPDGTKVTLNAESRLKYSTRFIVRERSVELQGEALFDVTSKNGQPFIVTTTDMKIRVLGTVFDVNAYPDNGLSLVSVASGKVEVDIAGGKIMLEKNSQVKIDNVTGAFEKLMIDANKYLLWTNGTLYFYQTPIREVVNTLNRYYPQTSIELAEGEYSYLISGEHDNKRMEAVLTSIIYSTGLKYKKTGNKIILYN